MKEQDPIEPFKEAVRAARDSGDSKALGDALIAYYAASAWTIHEQASWHEDGTIFVMSTDWFSDDELPECIGHLTPQEFYDWLGGDGFFDNKPAD